MSKGRKLIKGSALRSANLFLQIAISFFMMPFIIYSLGDRIYGLWVLIVTFIGYYGLLDLGLSSAVSRYVSRALGQDDINEMNYIINTSFVLFLLIGIIVLFISCICAACCFYFVESAIELTLFRTVIIILGLDMAFGFPMRVFEGILTSYLRYDLTTYADIIRLVITNIFIYYFLKNGHGIIAIALITLITNVFTHLLRMIFAKGIFPQLQIHYKFFTKERLRLLFEYSGKSLVARLGDILRFKVDSFVIAGFVDLNSVTLYHIAARLVEYFTSFIISTVGVMSPVFSQYEGKGDFDSIRKQFQNATKISVIISIFIGTSLIFYGKAFILRWMGNDYESSYYLLVILCVPHIIALMQNPSLGLLYGISKHHFFAISNAGEGVLNLVLSLVLVKYYGIYGVAMGTALAMIVFKVFIQPVYVCRIIDLSLGGYFIKTIFFTTLKSLLPLLCYFYCLAHFLSADYLRIVMTGSAQVIFYIPFAFFIIIDDELRKLIRQSIGYSFPK